MFYLLTYLLTYHWWLAQINWFCAKYTKGVETGNWVFPFTWYFHVAAFSTAELSFQASRRVRVVEYYFVLRTDRAVCMRVRV